jgi:hypothetical protein
MTSIIHKTVETVGQIGAGAIFLAGLWALAEICARVAAAWMRRCRSRSALAAEDFGSADESRAFDRLYVQCVRYREQTDSRDPGVVADAIERERPRLFEAAARYREAVIRARQERDRASVKPAE